MPRGARRFLPALGVAVLLALPLLPEILGTRRLVFRDAQVTHWPWRRVAMQSLSAGDVPFVNASASGGQPLLANPNAALLYPTMLLEKVLAPAAAFNIHYLLHVLWAFFGARALARRLGLSDGASFVAGIAFAFSGMVLSYASAFLNSGAAASWMPWCAVAALDCAGAGRGSAAARAGAAVGIAFGLQLLAGEPALSVMTLFFAGFLVIVELAGETRTGTGAPRGVRLLGRALLAAAAASALAGALLLPLAAVLPLTYRGQHVYSQRAFGASPFAAWRTVEWLFPRFNGDPGLLGAGAHWQYALHAGDLVYVWRVTFGVIPLFAIVIASLRRDFWTRRAAWLSGGALVSLLFAFGTSLPFFRLLSGASLFRRLRYPIKFYLFTTIAVALLAGFAVERLKTRRAGSREWTALAGAAILYAAAFFLAGPGGALDGAVSPLLAGLAAPAQALLPAIRASFRGDALLGLAALSVLGISLAVRGVRGAAHALGFATLLLALPWGLPLFVSADEKVLARPPALLGALRGAGRVYVSPKLPEFNVLAAGTAHPRMTPTVAQLARVQIEELIPQTGSPFRVRYAFDADPDGSYGYYNRLCGEALAASAPEEQSRLLRVFGARWMLAEDGFALPDFRPVTGFEIAGRRLLLLALDHPLPELRWASREHRRGSLSAALALLRSAEFRADDDVVLPGRSNSSAVGSTSTAASSDIRIGNNRATATIDATGAGHVLFSRTYFGAWKARVDGEPAPVLVANARDLAVKVERGRHRIEFEYDRRPFRAGVAIQTVVFLCVFASVFRTAGSRGRRT